MPTQLATVSNGALDVKVVPVDGQLAEVRFFRNEGLQNSLNKALESATKNSAVVEFEKNDTGINAAVATRIGDHWSVVVGYNRDDWGHSGVAGKVKYQW